MGIDLKDLGGGGPFRWLSRGLVFLSLLLVLTLTFLAGVDPIIAALAGFGLLLLGLLVLWILVARGHIKVKL